jgi:hypothetical protein
MNETFNERFDRIQAEKDAIRKIELEKEDFPACMKNDKISQNVMKLREKK